MSPKIALPALLLLVLGFPFLISLLSSSEEVSDPASVAPSSHEQEMNQGMSPSSEAKRQGPSGSHLPVLKWDMMQGLDFRSGKVEKNLAQLISSPVRIPGFVVPLDFNQTEASEFLLVPTFGACVHVPPPPPNQMVLVKMKNGVAPKREHGPVWVHGYVKVVEAKTQWGQVGFELMAEGSEPYTGGY